VSRPTELGSVCGHGHLARSCAYCDYEEDIAELRSQLAHAHTRIGRLRELVWATNAYYNDRTMSGETRMVEAASEVHRHNDLTPEGGTP
jgi:hypothetical protein